MLKKVAMLLVFLMSSGMAVADGSKIVLDIEFERNIPMPGGVNHLQSMKGEVQVSLDNSVAVSLENGWVLRIYAKDAGKNTDLALTVLSSPSADAAVLATPHLLAPLRESVHRTLDQCRRTPGHFCQAGSSARPDVRPSSIHKQPMVHAIQFRI